MNFFGKDFKILPKVYIFANSSPVLHLFIPDGVSLGSRLLVLALELDVLGEGVLELGAHGSEVLRGTRQLRLARDQLLLKLVQLVL